jgi:pyruvate,water dikinase
MIPRIIPKLYKTGPENYQRVNSFFTSDSQKETRELKGQIGNKGKIQGIIRVVRSAEQFNLFQEGEILVTGMTRPEFVPLMRRAAAIVTDEGGITCHAAIVSRELNKPCIIGTKFATHILKDGDEVLVDANQGIITIL